MTTKKDIQDKIAAMRKCVKQRQKERKAEWDRLHKKADEILKAQKGFLGGSHGRD